MLKINKQYTDHRGVVHAYETYADNADIKKALGVEPSKHWPDDGAVGQINLIPIIVTAKGSTILNGKDVVTTNNPIARRCFAHCPKCSKWYCAGHLMQHAKVHK